ncbi:molybdopterin biosynthesis protein MoeA [Synergistaceae bacterium OttesenSCG-928-D05]|nr:molybdopterin biosynthesis protein MoeA [Synergistaceae bacterium OttesenSCG-928-D05]
MVKDYPEHLELSQAWQILRGVFAEAYLNFRQEIEITDALGLVLARDIVALRNVPHYAASAVDGYALDADATIGASPATPAMIKKENYAWVNTGADLPVWANSVLMVEDSAIEDGVLCVYKSLTPSTNVRPLGEDVMAGQIIAREGEIVSPALISLFLNAGMEKVSVIKKPGVLFIPTGNEIVPKEEWLANPKPKSGTVAESNSLFIKASFAQWGFTVDVTPVLLDVPDILKEYVQKGAKEYDLVLVGAGSAKGDRDHTLTVFQALGEVLFRWIRMKPGRPAMAAAVDGKPVICLPGFPMSTAVVLWSLVYPLLKLLSGVRGDQKELIREAIGTREIWDTKLLVQHSSPAGVEDWLRVKTARVGDTLYSWVLTSGASVLWALAESDGIALLPASALECEKGTDVQVCMTKEVDLSRRILFQGSDDPAIQLLATPIKRWGGDFVSRAVGSMGGLAALGRGECHLAASHLLDEHDGTYNDSFIERFAAGRDWRRFLVFYRMQGIIVQAGNPKNIRSFEDLCNGDFVFTNRQPGAGTRVLFDYYLKLNGKSPEDVKGYAQQCSTHMEAANRVHTGLADATLGIKSAADALGLDFIPLAEEPYELVIPAEYLEHPGIAALLDALQDSAWRKSVEEMGGYRWPN